jgi:hypothetical protein
MSVQGRAPIRNYHQKVIPNGDQRKTALQVLSILDRYGNRAEYSDGITNGEIRDLSYKSKKPMSVKQIQIGLSRLEKMGGVEEDNRGYGYYRLTKPVDVLRGEIQHPYQGLLKRVLGSIFVLFGLGVIVLSGLSVTGNAVLSNASFPDTSLVLSFLLGIIGLGLLVKK